MLIFIIKRLLRLLFFLFILISYSYSSQISKKSNYAKIETYSFQESFEKDNPVTYWTSSSNLQKSTIKYSIDKKTFTNGNSSLLIDANILPSNNTKGWYYYLQIPLKNKPNLEGNLSFSMDVKMDKLAAKHVKIGLNLLYYPTSSGLYSFNKIFNVNKWTTIKSSNLQEETLEESKKWIKSNIYRGTPSDVGRAIDRIGILIKGQGAKHLKFHIDNIKITGTQTKNKLFIQNYKNHWHQYILKIRDELNKITKKLASISDINDSNLSLKYMKDKNSKNQYFQPKSMEELKNYIIQYNFNIHNTKSEGNITLLKFPPFKYYRLDGTKTPILETAKTYKLQMTKGEYSSIALLMKSKYPNTYKATVTSFKQDNGYSFSEKNLDLYIAKIWYQAGLRNTNKTGKFLTQELLLKDETLVKVDTKSKTNYLKVVDNSSKKTIYINISNPNKKFPKTDSITFNDSKELKPFKLDTINHKLLWGIIHIPKETTTGIYRAEIQFKNTKNKIEKSIPIEIEVLPFSLDKSKLTYSLYYHSRLNSNAKAISAFEKKATQLELELKDMKKHGVLYPTSYDKIEQLNKVLQIRDKLGFPKDKFYSLGIITYQANITEKIKEFKKRLDKYNYNKNALYIYSRDEADEDKLEKDKIDIKKAKEAGAKIFVAGYDYTHKHIGDLLDTLIYAGGPLNKFTKKQVYDWHKSGHEIFAYAAPQVGVENPEIYRRNFGCKLWKAGFDGAMNYAYQKQYGDFWNDFDDNPKAPSYREETFTYPTSSGLIGTVQWEGFREAITDVRYISTLENLRNKLKANGDDTSKLDDWINHIDCNADLTKLRKKIIDKILFYKKITK